MKQTTRVEVIPYDPSWPQVFASEALAIKGALGDNCCAVHHVGSTAVPGLAAKPIIDIIPVVRDIMQVDAATAHMQHLGYEALGENGMLFRRFFKKSGFNVHVYEQNSGEIDRCILFRDWMREHKEDQEAYSELKHSLAKEFAYDINRYCFGKDAFVASIDKKTEFCGLRLVKALTPTEWDAVRYFRQKYFFAPHNITDTYTWTFTHFAHQHLVLYQGAIIIGYAHLQLWPDKRACLRIIVIAEAKRKNGLGSTFLQACERWLKSKAYKSLHVEAAPTALAFYRKNGYVDRPFNDPDGYLGSPEDTAVGKEL